MLPHLNPIQQVLDMYTETDNRTPLDHGGSSTDYEQKFFERTCDIINAGAQTVMISIGHRSRLFDTMARLDPATSRQIADQAMLEQAGFEKVERHLLEHDPMNVWFVSRKEQFHVS